MEMAKSDQKVTPNSVIVLELIGWRSNKKLKQAEQTATLLPSQNQGWKLLAAPHSCLEEEGIAPLIPYPEILQGVYFLFHNCNLQLIPLL